MPEPAATAQTPPAEVPPESAPAPQEAAAAETPAENENIPSESAAPESAAAEAPPSAESPSPAAADAAEAPSPAAESTAASEAESGTGAEEGKDLADEESDSESHGILPKFAVIHIRLKILSGDKAIEAALDRVLPP